MSIFNFFVPNRQEVSTITNANPGVVTTTQDHGYETGYEVRFFFPLNVGMNELKDKVVTITVLTTDTFSIGVDTTNFDTYSPVGSAQVAQVIPVGSFTTIVLDPTQNNGNIAPDANIID